MSTKLSFADIVDLFATKTGQTKKDAELFLRELLDIMSSKMCEDGLLKIRDFGTFKVVDVESRESIDVNTGTKIVIASHRKITFAADKTLKDLVNKPFSLFEPELLNDGVSFEQSALDKVLDEELDENEADAEQTELEIEEPQNTNMQGRLSKALGEMTFDSNPIEDQVQESHPIEDNPKEIIPLEDTKVDILPSEDDEAAPFIEPTSDDEIPAVANDKPDTIDLEKEQPKDKSLKKLWIIAGTIFVVLGVAAVAFYLFNVDDDRANKPLQAAVAEDTDSTSKAAAPKPRVVVVKQDTLTHKTVGQPNADSTKTSANKIVKETERAKPNVPAIPKATTEVVSEGTTFRTLALKHYGSKEFWVYIYQANKAKIPNPNKLRYGLSITIPDAKSLGIDPKDPASIKRAKLLNDKILSEVE
jgi:nucleoid DNA-binding protein/nucleoid-associated protein YgaU